MNRAVPIGSGTLMTPGFTSILTHTLAALLIGGVIAVAPSPLNLLALVAWIVLLRRTSRTRPGILGTNASKPAAGPELDPDGIGDAEKPRWGRVRSARAIHFGVVSAVIIVAALLPVKETDRYFGRWVWLPRTEMTVGELSELMRTGALPFRLHLPDEPDLKAMAIQFPRQRMTIGQIVDVIEARTGLCRFVYACGTGSTILWGNYITVVGLQEPPKRHDEHPRGDKAATTGLEFQQSQPNSLTPQSASPDLTPRLEAGSDPTNVGTDHKLTR